LLGAITGAHGVRGEVRLTSFAENPRDIAAYGPLESEDGSERFEITALRQVGKSLVATLKGVSDRTAAEALRGTGLHVPHSVLPEAEEESWYHGDLIGLAVSTTDAGPVGRIVAVHNFGAGDLLEIAPDEGGDTELVPFTRDAVPLVDIAGGRVVINWPPAIVGDDGDK